MVKRPHHPVQAERDFVHVGRRIDGDAVGVGEAPAHFLHEVGFTQHDRWDDDQLLAGRVRVEEIVAPVVAAVIHHIHAAGREGRERNHRRRIPRAPFIDVAPAIGRVVQARSARAGERDVRGRVRLVAHFELRRVIRQGLREGDDAVGRVESAAWKVEDHLQTARGAIDRRAGSRQRHEDFLEITRRRRRARIAVRIEGREVRHDHLHLVHHAGAQAARADHEVRRGAVQGIGLPRRRSRSDVVVRAIDDLDVDEVTGGRARNDVPRQVEVRVGIDGLRGGEGIEVRCRRVAVARERNRVRLLPVVHPFDHHFVGAVRECGIQRALRREHLLQPAVVVAIARQWNDGGVRQDERSVRDRLRPAGVHGHHEHLVRARHGDRSTGVGLHPSLAFGGDDKLGVGCLQARSGKKSQQQCGKNAPSLGRMFLHFSFYVCSISSRTPGSFVTSCRPLAVETHRKSLLSGDATRGS